MRTGGPSAGVTRNPSRIGSTSSTASVAELDVVLVELAPPAVPQVRRLHPVVPEQPADALGDGVRGPGLVDHEHALDARGRARAPRSGPRARHRRSRRRMACCARRRVVGTGRSCPVRRCAGCSAFPRRRDSGVSPTPACGIPLGGCASRGRRSAASPSRTTAPAARIWRLTSLGSSRICARWASLRSALSGVSRRFSWVSWSIESRKTVVNRSNMSRWFMAIPHRKMCRPVARWGRMTCSIRRTAPDPPMAEQPLVRRVLRLADRHA